MVESRLHCRKRRDPSNMTTDRRISRKNHSKKANSSRGVCNLCLAPPTCHSPVCIYRFPTQVELMERMATHMLGVILLDHNKPGLSLQEQYRSVHWSDKARRLRLNICYQWRRAVRQVTYGLSAFCTVT